jgi:hypothetical protein
MHLPAIIIELFPGHPEFDFKQKSVCFFMAFQRSVYSLLVCAVAGFVTVASVDARNQKETGI